MVFYLSYQSMDDTFRRNVWRDGSNIQPTQPTTEQHNPSFYALRHWVSLSITSLSPQHQTMTRSYFSVTCPGEVWVSYRARAKKPNLEGTDLKVVIMYFQFENCLSWEIQNLFGECINNILIIGTYFTSAFPF